MRLSRVKAKLTRGEPVLITCCHFIDPSVYEFVSLRTPDLSGKLGGRFLGFLASDQGVL